MFRKQSHRAPQPKVPFQRYRELARAQKVSEVRLQQPYLFRQPPPS
jgi:hypothetical protein